MKTSHKFFIFALLLSLNFTSSASGNNTNIIQTVAVAEITFDNNDTALPLTVGVLKKHSIVAGGGGLSGWMTISVPANQGKQAHKILQDELAGLSQKQRDSFQIVWDWQKGNGRALDFLKDIPSLRRVTPNMSERDFVGILKRQKVDYKKLTPDAWTSYWTKPAPREHVFVTFKDSQCIRVARISGYMAKP
ncbi:MAG TPA: hypothetical protein VGY56_13290 [Verrucomicrobiae bacterium]|nr:hypothetical protein [Verrucomicrobiae bacterium]